MCGRDSSVNTTSLMDEQKILRAENGLTNLLETSDITDSMVNEAEKALRLLCDRVKNARTRRQHLCLQNEQLQNTITSCEERQRQVDQDIINARISAGDTLMTRDALARDVVRARRALDAADISEDQSDNSQDGRQKSWEQLATGMNDISSDGDNDDELRRLRSVLAEEMGKLNLAEKQLVDVVDEITRIRKKRTELHAKMRDAEQEW